MTPKEMAKCAYLALEEKKAEDITVIDISSFCACRLFYYRKRYKQQSGTGYG